MRVARIEIDGQEHLLCFSLRVLRAVCERYGGVEHLDAATSSEDQAHNLSEAVWQMATMMDAGDRYARERGLDNPPPLTEEQLLDLCTIYDFAKFRAKIRETIISGSEAQIQAEFPNGETTQEESA